MEGRSLRPAFDNRPLEREALYWEHEGNAAVRVGDWKLVRQREGGTGEWELYNLKADRTEMHNLAAAEPERVRQLTALWEAWAQRAHIVPEPGSAQAGKAKAAKKNTAPTDPGQKTRKKKAKQ